jgi:hypothetical protein
MCASYQRLLLLLGRQRTIAGTLTCTDTTHMYVHTRTCTSPQQAVADAVAMPCAGQGTHHSCFCQDGEEMFALKLELIALVKFRAFHGGTTATRRNVTNHIENLKHI